MRRALAFAPIIHSRKRIQCKRRWIQRKYQEWRLIFWGRLQLILLSKLTYDTFRGMQGSQMALRDSQPSLWSCFQLAVWFTQQVSMPACWMVSRSFQSPYCWLRVFTSGDSCPQIIEGFRSLAAHRRCTSFGNSEKDSCSYFLFIIITLV